MWPCVLSVFFQFQSSVRTGGRVYLPTNGLSNLYWPSNKHSLQIGNSFQCCDLSAWTHARSIQGCGVDKEQRHSLTSLCEEAVWTSVCCRLKLVSLRKSSILPGRWTRNLIILSSLQVHVMRFNVGLFLGAKRDSHQPGHFPRLEGSSWKDPCASLNEILMTNRNLT